MSHQYNEMKAAYEVGQKTVAALQAEQAELQNKLIRVSFSLQVQGRGITHDTPVWFTIGNAG